MEHTIFYNSRLRHQANNIFRFIAYYDIIQVECDKDCLAISLSSNRTLYTYESLTYFEINLPKTFIRIHRSYIINIAYIKEYCIENSKVLITMSNGSKFFVARSLKNKFLNYISNLENQNYPNQHCLECELFNSEKDTSDSIIQSITVRGCKKDHL